MSTDVIEKSLHLAAPVSRVWRALSDAAEFGRWFGVELLDPFVPGRPVRARWVPFTAEAMGAIAAKAELPVSSLAMPAEDAVFCTVVAMEPERTFSFRWVPFGIEATPADEPPTLVEFRLTPEGGGTRLTVRESGFDGLSPERKRRALRMNTDGWSAQLRNVGCHVDGT